MAESTPPKQLPSEKRILVVDDDDAVLQLFRTAIEVEGFQVRTARDGRNLAAKAVEFQPHLIVTDLMMPGGSGYEVLRQLQADETTRATPVIIVTGHVLDDSTKTLLKQESNLAAYLEKPVRPERLLRRIHEILHTLSGEEQRARVRDIEFRGFGDMI